jgi:hypothetical protein
LLRPRLNPMDERNRLNLEVEELCVLLTPGW